MIRFVKKYWAEILVFGAILGVLLVDQTPNMTWINTDSDGVHYVYASKYLYASHKSGSPLYILLGNLFLHIPFGTLFWRMGLISVLSTFIGAVLINLIIREHLKGVKHTRLYAIISSLIFGGSALIISQSTIVETYALSTMLMLLAYYLVIRKRYTLATIPVGAGLAVHGLMVFVALPLFLFNKEMRQWKHLGILAGFALFYIYNPLVGIFNPPTVDMWANLTFSHQITDVYNTMMMLSGGLAIYDLPKRLFDTIGLLGVSLGLGLLVVIIYILREKKAWRSQLFWLFMIPILYYVGNFAPQTYVYLCPAIGFGSVIVGVTLSKLSRKVAYATLAVAIGVFVYNANYFDIGRTLDPQLAAVKFYTEELPKVGDGQILMAQQGWEWSMTVVYDKEESKNIIPVCRDTLFSPGYQEHLARNGINFLDNPKLDRVDRGNYIAVSIVELNENVWTTIPIDPQTYGGEVVVASKSLVDKSPKESPGNWHWKPSNPYDIITGSIEVDEWRFLTLSNYNVMFYVGLASIGLILNWLIFVLPAKRRLSEDTISETSEKPRS